MKYKYILDRCNEKRVLELGAASAGLTTLRSKIRNDTWLHAHIKGVAEYLVGIDIVPADIDGYTLITDDVQNLEHGQLYKAERFDVIVAGDIIEHLFNPGLFLDQMKKISSPFTELVITTPNARHPAVFFSSFFRKYEKCMPDHTCWYTMKTLKQLLEMKGYEIIDESYGSEPQLNGVRPILKYLLFKLFKGTGYQLFVTAKMKL